MKILGMDITDFGSAVSNSLSYSSILVLTALGLAITFGVMRVINMAHGEMLMLGAYTAFVLTDKNWLPKWIADTAQHYGVLPGFDFHIFSWHIAFDIEFNLFWAIPISFFVVAFVGYLMEVFLIRHLYGRPLDTLLATWGVGLILQQLVNIRFGANLQPLHLPEIFQPERIVKLDPVLVGTSTLGLTASPFGQGHLFAPLATVTEVKVANIVQIGDIAIPYYRIFIFGVALLFLLVVYVWFFKTSSGLKIRAVVQNRPMAASLGISTRRVDSLTFAFACGLAGVAGCILAHLYNVKYLMGNDYIVDAFMVVILGGMGQLAGSVGAAVVIGTATAFVEKWMPALMHSEGGAVSGSPLTMAKVVIYLFVVGFILIRPSGLFALKERSYE
jgi:urea transport system permease protein